MGVLAKKSLVILLIINFSFTNYSVDFILNNYFLHEEKIHYIFKSGTEGYKCFRIPTIIKSNENNILAFVEARKKSCSDTGNIDLVLKRSTDGGKTWGKLITVWDESDNTAGNPAPVVDKRTGRIHLLMTWNLGDDDIGEINRGTSKDTRRVFYTFSDDDGLNWKNPIEITSSVKKKNWGWYATGPVHGIQITKGEHNGRLLIPCDHNEMGKDPVGYSHVIYSDDNGKSWKIGGISSKEGTNESTLAKLSDGSLMLNMRSNNHKRTIELGASSGENFGKAILDEELEGPRCQGSLLSTKIKGRHMLFFSNPADKSVRKTMTLKLSTDDGRTWTGSYIVHKGPSAYSDIVMVTKNEIGILFEGGQENPYEGIAFKKIQIQKIQHIIN